MRIVVHDYGGYPFSAQLSRELARRGHDTLYLCAQGFRSPKASVEARPDDPPGLLMEGIDVGQAYRGGASARRLLQERRYGQLVAARLGRHQPDVVVSANCPLDAQAAIQRSSRAHGAAFVFWLQDLYGHAVGRMLERRVPIGGRLIGARFAYLERRLLQASDGVVAITADYLPTLERWQIPPQRTSVVENWAPLDEAEPAGRANAWSRAHGLADAPVLLYAGTLGRKHDPRLLLALAKGLPEARVVVVSDGVGADWLRGHAAGVANLVLLPLQQASQFAEVLGSADVLVAVLEKDAGAFSVPSKVLTYLTAGRPILAAIPAANLAARTITEAGAGRVVDPADVDGFVAAARELLGDADARSAAAEAARAHALRAFDIHRIADRFEGILRNARSSADARMAPASRDT